MNMFKCLFAHRSFHNLMWPHNHIQKCRDCTKEFPALIRFGEKATVKENINNGSTQFHKLNDDRQRAV